ncbi:sensor histidine kinase [Desulfovibrio inopinatus]|uniref:sensor histidine kinase n=1 Tax=Desulfovibrio inopinatus TaxID=102109 RepID=UPI0004124593|nr:ATP-binding protein [Desulfovibrio inopinatus]
MTLHLTELPIFLVDILGSTAMIVLSCLSTHYARRLMHLEPRELLWSYLYMLTVALMAFSVGRGVGHLVRDMMIITGHKALWPFINPLSGAINTITFIFIAAITSYYVVVEKAFLLLEQAHTKLGEAFEEIRQNRDQMILLERYAISDRMAATLAHETRNPIFTIANFAKSLLRKSGKDDPIAAYLQIIVEESHKLEGLIDGILKVRHDLPCLMQRVSVQQILTDLEKTGKIKGAVARIDIHTVATSEELWLHIDFRSLLVGLTEILMNAIEASPHGGTVTIATEREDDKAIFRITDTGKGIPATLFPKIFEPCFSTKEFSTGLGLGFAREILEVNGGHLKVESTLDKGTTVIVALPLDKNGDEVCHELDENLSDEENPPQSC